MPTDPDSASFPLWDTASDAPSMYERGPRRRSQEGIWSAQAPLWPADRTGVGPSHKYPSDAPGEGPGYEGPIYEGPGYEGPIYEGPGYEGPGYEGPGYEGPGYEAPSGYEATLTDAFEDGTTPERRNPGGVRDEGMDSEDYERYGIGLDDDGDDDDDEILTGSTATRNALEWAVVLVGAVLVALLLRASLFQAFWIPSESMEDTLEIEDRVLVNKLSYRLHEIHRGDVVVFTRPDDQPGEIRDLIKRVIGIPGDTIEGRDNTVYVNGSMLIEPYLDEGTFTDEFGPIVVPAGQVFVMGDNREESFDSRRFGTVSEDRVVGRAFVLFWPVDRIGWL